VLETLAALFAVGTLGFEVVLAVTFIGIWILVSNRRGLGALLTFALFVAFVQLVCRWDVYHFIRENTRTVGWWVVHGRNEAAKFDDLKASFSKTKLLEPGQKFTDELKVEFATYLRKKGYNPNLDTYRDYNPERDDIRTDFDHSRDTVGRWIGWWPWCILGLADDLFIAAGRVIKENLRGVLNYISAKVFGDRASFVPVRGTGKPESDNDDDWSRGRRQR
jgi:hypothetical protein